MPVIKARTTGKHSVRHTTRLFRENNETLFAYAMFIAESTEYVLNELIETVLAKDREFSAWREQHPGPHVPKPGQRWARRPRAQSAAVPAAAPSTPTTAITPTSHAAGRS